MGAAIIIHGGVYGVAPVAEVHKLTHYLEESLDAGWKALMSGAAAERAAVAALRPLEACGYFDAGRGSFPNAEGRAALDVGLMCGDGRFASVMDIPCLAHPSEFALDLLERGEHHLFVWNGNFQRHVIEGGTEARKRFGYAEDNQALISDYARSLADRVKHVRQGGTVGCVARDRSGRIAACTSTGGTAHKPVGRVGDSPLIGSGVFARDGVCGISATGWGEKIVLSLYTPWLVRRLAAIGADGSTAALREGMRAQFSESFSGDLRQCNAGFIALGPSGAPGFVFRGHALPIAWQSESPDHAGNVRGIEISLESE